MSGFLNIKCFAIVFLVVYIKTCKLYFANGRVDVILESTGFKRKSKASKMVKNSCSLLFYMRDWSQDVKKLNGWKISILQWDVYILNFLKDFKPLYVKPF